MTNALFTTGLPELDALLGGGFRPGTVNLIAGPAGSGKTTLVDTIVRANAFDRQAPTLLVDCEYDARLRSRRLLAAVSGVPISNLASPTAAEAARIHAAQDTGTSAPVAVCEARTADAAMGIVRESSAQLIAVDGPLFQSPEAFAALWGVAADKDAAVVVTAQMPPLLVDRPPMEMTQLADAVVMLPSGSRQDSCLAVAKARAGHLGKTTVVAEFEVARFVPPQPSGVA